MHAHTKAKKRRDRQNEKRQQDASRIKQPSRGLIVRSDAPYCLRVQLASQPTDAQLAVHCHTEGQFLLRAGASQVPGHTQVTPGGNPAEGHEEGRTSEYRTQ